MMPRRYNQIVSPGGSGGGREQLLGKVIPQQRGLPALRVGAYPIGPLDQSSFIRPSDQDWMERSACVDEEGLRSLRRGLFLVGGQHTFFKYWMAGSPRSRARPVGRCQIQLPCDLQSRAAFQRCPSSSIHDETHTSKS
jgi:hypothetical protein